MGVVASENLSVGAVTLPAMDTYKIRLPQMLSERGPVSSMTFCSISSGPTTLHELPKGTLNELVRTLIGTVHRDYQNC